jgi:glyoxylate reductase
MPELSRIERPSVRVTRTLLPAVEKRMAELFDTRFNADDVPLTRDALVAAMADCDVLVPTVTDTIDASIIAAAPPRLKLIAS